MHNIVRHIKRQQPCAWVKHPLAKWMPPIIRDCITAPLIDVLKYATIIETFLVIWRIIYRVQIMFFIIKFFIGDHTVRVLFNHLNPTPSIWRTNTVTKPMCAQISFAFERPIPYIWHKAMFIRCESFNDVFSRTTIVIITFFNLHRNDVIVP